MGDHTAIEVKAKEDLSAAELKPPGALAGKTGWGACLCVSLEPPCEMTADDPKAIFRDPATGAVLYTTDRETLEEFLFGQQ